MPSDELVLVIPAAELTVLGAFTGLTREVAQYRPLLAMAHEFRPRSQVETDPTWLQLIPYVVLRHAGRIFHYTRGAAGGEIRLHAKQSIGIGGHINPVDASNGNAYRAGLARELDEEVRIAGDYREQLLGFVFDPSTPVGQVHLGVVHVFELEKEDVTPRDAGLTACGFAPLAELRSGIESFETWSRFALEAL